MKQIVAALKPLFNEINSRFDQINSMFEQVNSRFDQVESRFAQVDSRFDQVNGRLDKIEGDLSDVKGTLRRTVIKVSNLEGDVADIKRGMATKQDMARRDLRLASFMTEIQNLRRERTWVDKSYLRHEDRLDDHDKRLSRLEAHRA